MNRTHLFSVYFLHEIFSSVLKTFCFSIIQLKRETSSLLSLYRRTELVARTAQALSLSRRVIFIAALLVCEEESYLLMLRGKDFWIRIDDFRRG